MTDRTYTRQQMLEWRAAVIRNCIEVVRISEAQPDASDSTIFFEGAAHQRKASIAALEFYLAGLDKRSTE